MRGNDIDRLFLQAFMTRRVASESLMVELWKKSKDAVKKVDPNADNGEEWQEFFSRVRRSLEDLRMDIKVMQEQDTGYNVYALVNNVGDELSQLATTYSPIEIAYFKLLVEQIVTAPHDAYSIGSMDAIDEFANVPGRQGKGKSKLEAQAILSSFVYKGWLAISPQRGRYSLGIRTMLELHNYIKETFEDEPDMDLQACHICDAYVFSGLRCQGDGGKCKAKIHKPCFKRWKDARNNNCPECRGDWPNARALRPVGEDAVRGDERNERRRRAKNRRAANDEEDGEEIDIEGPSQRVKKEKKPKTRKSGGRKRRDEDEEEEAAATPESEEEAEASPMEDSE